MEWFEQRGVELTVERGNRVYPASGKALDIFLALIGELEQNPNVTIRKNTTVKSIETFEGQATAVILERGERIPCRHIILATGGLSYPTTGSTGAGYRICRELGHTVVDPVPSLVALKCQEKIPEELVGFQLKNVQLSILDSQFPIFNSAIGEMTFANDGLAGPIVLSASRIATRPLQAGQTLTARLDLKPGLTLEQLDKRLLSDINTNGTRIFNDALRLWLPAELIPLALPQLHIEYYKRLHQLTGEERRRLRDWLKGVKFTLTGTHDWNEAGESPRQRTIYRRRTPRPRRRHRRIQPADCLQHRPCCRRGGIIQYEFKAIDTHTSGCNSATAADTKSGGGDDYTLHP